MMFDTQSLDVFKRLVESFAPSGFESEAVRVIHTYMKPYADEIISDKLGSVAYVVNGEAERPRVLLVGHIDEVGFVVSGIDEKTGFLSFNPLGGWWDQVLLGQRVIVRTRKTDLPGVIAAKPPHVLPQAERTKLVERKNMYIDIGVSSKREAEELDVKIGDPVVPWSPLTLLHGNEIAMGKAFDDRVGTFVMMEVIRRIKAEEIRHPNRIYGAASVQEEVGSRGAQTIAHVVDPDVAFILEVDIAGDVPGIKPMEAPTRMGKGPALLTFDRSMIPNQRLKEFVIQTAREAHIPLQLSHMYGGGTDAGRIHISRSGCPSIVIGIPTRHIHSHVGILSLSDVEHAVRLIIELVKEIDETQATRFTALSE
jgi:endoglucanase